MEWYLELSREGCRVFFIINFICIAFHAITIPAEMDRFRKNRFDRFINEGLNIVYLIYLLCMEEKLYKAAEGTYELSGLTPLQVFQHVLFVLSVVIVICEAVFLKHYNQLGDPIFLFFTLSFFEKTDGLFYVGAIAALITYFFLRAGYIIIRDRREKQGYLSFASVNEAVNSLREGLLFCDESGFILILNIQMSNLMRKICGKSYKNGLDFFEDISDRGKITGATRVDFSDKPVFAVDGRVWSYSKDYLNTDGKIFVQIAANDVTSLWKAMTDLEDTRQKLFTRSDELKSAIKNIEDMALENETIMMKNSFHDVLGHRIALLLRNMRENKEPDEELLKSFAKSFYSEIRDGAYIDESQRLDSIVKTMKDIDIDVKVEGELPGVEAYATLYVDIIREAATNAVRHGFASEIEIDMSEDDESFGLVVSNNGLLPGENITEGGGLSGIRRKLSIFEGSLDVSFDGKYTLTCRIPK